jgi:hypothetical protein
MLHPNEVNNIAYLGFRYGHGVEMTTELWDKIQVEVGIESSIDDILEAVGAHAWRLKGRPDQYELVERTQYAKQVAEEYMKQDVKTRRDLSYTTIEKDPRQQPLAHC